MKGLDSESLGPEWPWLVVWLGGKIRLTVPTTAAAEVRSLLRMACSIASSFAHAALCGSIRSAMTLNNQEHNKQAKHHR